MILSLILFLLIVGLHFFYRRVNSKIKKDLKEVISTQNYQFESIQKLLVQQKEINSATSLQLIKAAKHTEILDKQFREVEKKISEYDKTLAKVLTDISEIKKDLTNSKTTDNSINPKLMKIEQELFITRNTIKGLTLKVNAIQHGPVIARK